MDRAALLRLVAEPTRSGILAQLTQGERSVRDLVVALEDEQTNVSHHLRHLRDTGLGVCRREGRLQRYRIADPEVARLLGELTGLADRLERACYTARLGLPGDASFHGYG